jgi:DNA methyltransferase 1-associated protein 1
MSSLDVRDMLNLPSNAGPRPAKKQKTTTARPNLKGLQREVQSLGGDNPIAIVPEIQQFKKRRLANRKPVAHWELREFRNSARGEDDLKLRHWRRKDHVPAATVKEKVVERTVELGDDGTEREVEKEVEREVEDSAFAKFNVKVNVPKYDDEQYESKLKSSDWSKEETDYLMGLIQDFDLRWPVIWDRYEYQPAPPPAPAGAEGEITALVTVPDAEPRTMEDLKARYYEVASKMMAVHRPVQFMSHTEFSLHQLMSSFNPQQEVLRKKFAEAAMARTPEERKEEDSLLIELKRIMARSERLHEERKELYSRLEAPPSTSNVGIYTTSAGLGQLVQQLMNADKSKKRKSLMENATPASATSNTPTAGLDRRDSTVREPAAPAPPAKKGSVAAPSGPAERQKLTKEEEVILGVMHHERLTSGPYFRHDKASRLISGKSAVVAAKITNTLAELDIPPRLTMPTYEVCQSYEALLASVNTLLDAKKIADKLDAEIKLTEALKVEREKKERKERGEPDPEEAAKEKKEDEAKDTVEGELKTEGVEKQGSVPPSGKAGGHKRSASVLSQVSDKSTKRMKK